MSAPWVWVVPWQGSPELGGERQSRASEIGGQAVALLLSMKQGPRDRPGTVVQARVRSEQVGSSPVGQVFFGARATLFCLVVTCEGGAFMGIMTTFEAKQETVP